MSRLTQIRQNEAKRLSLTLSETSDFVEDDFENDSGFVSGTPQINESDTPETPLVNGESDSSHKSLGMDNNVNSSGCSSDMSKTEASVNNKHSVDNQTLWFLDSSHMLHRDDSVFSDVAQIDSTIDEDIAVDESHSVCMNGHVQAHHSTETRVADVNIKPSISNTIESVNISNSADNFKCDDVSSKSTVLAVTGERGDLSTTAPCARPLSTSSRSRVLNQQKSRERKASMRRQRSLAEMSWQWLVQVVTGQAGEQLDLPWIYYAALTALCGCVAAATAANPLYMMLVVATVSLLSFRFVLCDDDDQHDQPPPPGGATDTHNTHQ